MLSAIDGVLRSEWVARLVLSRYFKIFIAILVWDILRTIVKNHKIKDEDKTLERVYLKYAITFVMSVILTFFILSQFEVTRNLLSVIIASSGILAAVVGFAAQESLGNIINGLIMIFFKTVKIGDYINIRDNDITGTVEAITIKHTILRTYRNSLLTVPNSVLNKSILENYSIVDPRTRYLLDIAITHDSDVNVAMTILDNIIRSHPMVIPDTDPSILVRDITLNSIELRAEVWTEDISENFKTCSDIRIALLKEFKNNSIKLASNTMRVRQG